MSLRPDRCQRLFQCFLNADAKLLQMFERRSVVPLGQDEGEYMHGSDILFCSAASSMTQALRVRTLVPASVGGFPT